MGSMIELNDTLRISKKQGFPEFLDIEKHLEQPYTLDEVKDKVFEFRAKEGVRVFQQPPVRNHLVEFLNGKWLYWGLCYITEITHDYGNGVTSGKYKIVRLNTPEEMKQHFKLTHIVNIEQNYFED
jgi:hypothetical protein